jgi:carboxylesterase
MVNRIYKKIKNVLFADPHLLFQEETGLIKQAFYFPAKSERAILLIHGWTSTSYEVRRLGKYLNENGYTVLAPMLRGHGTTMRDLNKVNWKMWLADIRKEYKNLKKTHKKVFIGGTSIGANLSAFFAGEEKEIDGLVLMAMPYKIKFEKLAIVFAKVMLLCGKKYNHKIYPPTFGLSTTITRLISYQTYPIKSALETFELVRESRKNLHKITQPCLIIQSKADHIVMKKSLELIFSKIGSKIKKKEYIAQAYHTFISDIKNEHIFKDILYFLDEN